MSNDTEYREPTSREHQDAYDGNYQPSDRVLMIGTDLYGTVRSTTSGITEGPRQVLVDWDYYSPEEGERSWIETGYLTLTGVAVR